MWRRCFASLGRVQDYAKRYLRFKGCHLLVSVLSGWLQREYHRALVPFKLEMERQRREERHHAAVTVQRHVRGYVAQSRHEPSIYLFWGVLVVSPKGSVREGGSHLAFACSDADRNAGWRTIMQAGSVKDLS